jgi:hypothetical protein
VQSLPWQPGRSAAAIDCCQEAYSSSTRHSAQWCPGTKPEPLHQLPTDVTDVPPGQRDLRWERHGPRLAGGKQAPSDIALLLGLLASCVHKYLLKGIIAASAPAGHVWHITKRPTGHITHGAGSSSRQLRTNITLCAGVVFPCY